MASRLGRSDVRVVCTSFDVGAGIFGVVRARLWVVGVLRGRRHWFGWVCWVRGWLSGLFGEAFGFGIWLGRRGAASGLDDSIAVGWKIGRREKRGRCGLR